MLNSNPWSCRPLNQPPHPHCSIPIESLIKQLQETTKFALALWPVKESQEHGSKWGIVFIINDKIKWIWRL